MLRVLPTLIEPDTWTLAFHRTSKYWWVRWLAFGKYKHVSAFAWVGELDLWLYYDVTLPGTKVLMLPDSPAATAWISDRTADADLLQIRRRLCESYAPSISLFSCVSAISHLIGIPGGALPLTLYRAVIAHGGEIIDGRPAEAADRSGDLAHPAGSAG